MSHRTPRVVLGLALPILAALVCWLAAGASVAPSPAPAADGPALTMAPAAPVAAPAVAMRTDAVARRGFWSAPVGARFRYELADRLTIRMSQPNAAPQAPGLLDVRATATATVLGRRDGDVLVEVAFADLRLAGADGREDAADPLAAAYVAAAATATLVRIDGRGRIRGFGFAAELDGDQRHFLRGAIHLLCCETPADGATAWTSEGGDHTGRFEARFEAVAAAAEDVAVIRRVRQRYTSYRGLPALPKHEIAGAATARFDLARGWFAGLELAETVRLQIDLADLTVVTDRRAVVRLVGEDAVAVAAAAWDRVAASATGDDERTGGYAEAAQAREWRQRLQGVALGDLLAEIDRLLAAAAVDAEALDAAFQKLQWLLRGDDAATRALADQLLAGQLAAATAGVAVGALGAAGTAAAQAALVALRGDGVQPELREHATVACLQLATPSAQVMQSLADEAQSGRSPRGSSLMVLGALATRAEGALADGGQPLAALLAMERECAARGELDAWVHAVGNTRTPQALGVALRLLDHGDVAVRAACCAILRHFPAAVAHDALVRRGLADADPAVRMEALAVLARRSEAGIRAVIQSTATLDADVAVREYAARILAGE